MPAFNSQCFQILEEEVHNDTGVAMARMAFSAMLLSTSRRPSVTKRESALRRLIV
jgi:hypothetical protein